MERQTVECWKGKKDYEVPMIQRTGVEKKRSWEDNYYELIVISSD